MHKYIAHKLNETSVRMNNFEMELNYIYLILNQFEILHARSEMNRFDRFLPYKIVLRITVGAFRLWVPVILSRSKKMHIRFP